MAKIQRQWKKGAEYQITGASKKPRKVEFIGTAKDVRDVGDVLMFRPLRRTKSRARSAKD